MKKRKGLIVLIVIVLLLAAVVTVLVVRRRKKVKGEPLSQSIASGVSSAVTAGYSPESFPLRKGMFGEKIRIMQDELKFKGFDLGTAGIDGKFGDKTLAAVRANFFNPQKTEVTELEWLVFNGMYAARQNLKNLA